MKQNNTKKKTTKNKSSGKPRDKHDYQLMEAAYITTEDLKIKDFAKKFKISPGQLYTIRKKEKWDEKKEAYHRAIAEEVIEKAKEEQVVNYLEIKRRLDTAVEEASRILTDVLKQPEQFYLQYTSPMERLKGFSDYQVETQVADTKRIELYTRALATVNTIVNQRLQVDEEMNSDADKVQLNMLEGEDEYKE